MLMGKIWGRARELREPHSAVHRHETPPANWTLLLREPKGVHHLMRGRKPSLPLGPGQRSVASGDVVEVNPSTARE